MIVKMKHLTLLCVANESTKALETLRELGCVHLDLSCGKSQAYASAKKGFADAERAVRILSKAARDGDPAAADKRFDAVRNADIVSVVLKADDECSQLSESIESLRQTVRKYEPYGDFDPELAKSLIEKGIDIASVAEIPDPLPSERLSETMRKLSDAQDSLSSIINSLALLNQRVGTILDQYPELKDKVAFESARDTLATQGAVSWIEGWVSEDSVPQLRACAVTQSWGILLRDATEDEAPPTLIRPPKLFRPVAALFKGLGIAPAYTEADVSVPFMCYFSIFFAMLVGDGAYGMIFLAATLFGWRKTKPAEGARHRPRVIRSWLTLMTVFSSATVLWGFLSNTWFGASIPVANVAESSPAILKFLAAAANCIFNAPTVAWLADPSYNNMMLLCFTIGASHLMLARIWNGICRLPDTTALAEFGWAGVLLTMYLVTNSIVGIFPGLPVWGYYVGAISVALVFLFTVKPSELKTRAAELGMLPLSIMSALGDIISYVRLFAVGLASVKVAENFNSMATGLVAGEQAWWLTAVMSILMVAILCVGHGLNLAMAGLSILVHAVRLNTLEFSNHKGVTWAGFAFNPFKRETRRAQ